MIDQIPPGKRRRLLHLTDKQGRFEMMAIDQREALRTAIARVTKRQQDQIPDNELITLKKTITRLLAPYATAVLTDPEYGYPQSLEVLPPKIGLLLAHEKTGYEAAGPSGGERKAILLDNWSVRKAQTIGADAIKLLIFYNPGASKEVLQHQHNLVKALGEECDEAQMPFLLEIVTYPIDGGATDTPQFAERKPDLVVRSARKFSKPEFKVDILKMEFPADLNWTKEFSRGAFDGKERTPVYALSDVAKFCKQLNQACAMPWVILSAGVDIQEFLLQVDMATEAGASGFLCGRAIWKDAVNLYPAVDKMENWLSTQGVKNFRMARAHAYKALPWYLHRRFSSKQ